MSGNPIPEGSIVITPAQVYEKVTSLTDVVTKLVAQDEAEQGRAARLEQKVDAIDGRVSAIEKKIWIVTGFAAAAGGLLGNWLPSVLGQ
jgi:vacuolar-type H+-ATPase subunit D/Vma8